MKRQEDTPVYEQLTHLLKEKLMEQHYHVEFNPERISLMVDHQVEVVASDVIQEGLHPNLTKLVFVVMHPEYFPDGIVEYLVGVGTTLHEKLESGIDNFLSTIFPPIMDGFNDTHDPDLDFNDRDGILWHPKEGQIGLQGNWEEEPETASMREILNIFLKSIIPNQKFNWLKIYAAKDGQGNITHECNLNNQPWEAGAKVVADFAADWKNPNIFCGLKQFIVYRRCDAFDN
ncbi:MAG: hypothetical protein JO154_01680 [Chitinophaga sp.]|uniref:DUF6348 family protein n=1 Tax=Chitinophaga sp. TaxID=1869181 RepID=UPI0025BEC086|nr:DUF6348 family protein [Chitinophaga sp.]MBV8251289.1 hypothetical protein [Chitinophaga sp.]